MSKKNKGSGHLEVSGFIKNMFLKFLQNSKESTCAGVSFSIKLQAQGL